MYTPDILVIRINYFEITPIFFFFFEHFLEILFRGVHLNLTAYTFSIVKKNRDI